MKTKEIIVCVIVLFILVFTASNVYATNTATSIDDLLNNTNSNVNTDVPIGNVTIGENNTDTNQNLNNNANNNVTDLPSTGVDYSIVAIIAICGVSAVYAYKKIKDYNIK